MNDPHTNLVRISPRGLAVHRGAVSVHDANLNGGIGVMDEISDCRHVRGLKEKQVPHVSGPGAQ